MYLNMVSSHILVKLPEGIPDYNMSIVEPDN